METNYNAVKDSGKRREFKTGSVRDVAEGKGRFDLFSPWSLFRLARHYENGSKKYGDRNWEKGQPANEFISSALRHIYRYLAGFRDEDHLSAAVWNLMALIHFEELAERGNQTAIEMMNMPALPEFTATDRPVRPKEL